MTQQGRSESTATPQTSPTADGTATRAQILEALRTFGTELLLLVTPRGGLVAVAGVNPMGHVDREQLGRHIGEYLHPDDLPRVFDVIERARATAGFEESITVRARHADGSWRVLRATVIDSQRHPVLRGRLTGAVLRVRDVTDQVDTGAIPAVVPTAVAGDRFLSLAEALPLGILSADARGQVVFCNEAAEQILNLPAENLMGSGWERTIQADDLPEVLNAAGQVVRTGVSQQVVFRVQTGLFVRWASARFVPLAADGVRTGWIATIDDITDRRRAESELAHQATHDPLTGLPNRTLLEDRLHQACARLRRGTHSVLVLFVDLDGFKEINDTYGHRAGDEVLIEVGRRLRQVLRDIDTIARLGGDEFVAVCEDLDPDGVKAVVARVSESFEVPMLVDGHRLRVGGSVGVALTGDPDVDVGELLARADQAMYRVKRERRNA